MITYSLTEYRDAVKLVSDYLGIVPGKWPKLSIAKRPPRWAHNIMETKGSVVYGVSDLSEPHHTTRSRIYLDIRACNRFGVDPMLVLMHEIAHVKFRLGVLQDLEEAFASNWEQPLYKFYTRILEGS